MIGEFINIGAGLNLGELGIGAGDGTGTTADELYLFRFGGVPWYTTYTRFGNAFSEDADRTIITNVTDEPPYEFVNGQKRLRQYEGTNKVEVDGIPIDSAAGILNWNPVTDSIVFDPLTNTNIYEIDNVSGGSTRFITLEGEVGNLNKHTASVCWRVINAVVGTQFRELGGAGWVIQKDTASTVFECVTELNFTPVGTASRLEFRIPVGQKIRFYLPQLTETTYKLPDIPSSKDGPVTVNKSLTNIITRDINTASYYYDGSYYALADYITEICKTCAFSVCMTLKLNDITSPQTTLSNIKSSANAFGISVVSGDISAGIYDGASYFVKASGTITTNEVKVIATYDGVSDFKFYIDAVQAVGTNNPAIDLTLNKFSIGGRVNGDLTRTIQDGSQWDIQVFNKVLSSQEIDDYQNGVLISDKINAYTLSEYREDALVLDSESSNNAVANSPVSNIISENDAFGYPVNAKAPTMGTYVTDDGVYVPKELREFFGGEARGADLWTNVVAQSDWSDNGDGTYTLDTATGDQFIFANSGGTAAIPGKTYEYCCIEVISGSVYVRAGATGTQTTLGVGIHNVRSIASGYGNIYIWGLTVGTIVRPSPVREVSPAVGVVPFTAYIPHALPPDLVTNGGFDADTDWAKGTGWTISGGTANCDGTQIATSVLFQESLDADGGKLYVIKHTISNYSAGSLQIRAGGQGELGVARSANGSYTCTLFTPTGSTNAQNIQVRADVDFIGSVDDVQAAEALVILRDSFNRPLLYVDPFDGLVKGTEGTNTCVSASTVVTGSDNSGWFALNADEMWITLAGTKGSIETFAGYFPDIGNRIFGLTNGIYQTIRELYFKNEVPFDHVFDSGEQVTDDGEIVIEYT